jgi:serine protease AprX
MQFPRARLRSLPFLVILSLSTVIAPASAQLANPSLPDRPDKLDSILKKRASLGNGQSRVIIRNAEGASDALVAALISQAGGSKKKSLPNIAAGSALVPNAALKALAKNPLIAHISHDRVIAGTMERTGATIGATAVRQELGVDGSGVGVAIVDSGAMASVDDLSGTNRVVQFVDFVDGQTAPYDDYGHGTHVAGIIAGSGADSGGARMGIAPGAQLIVLKVLDASGQGHISDVIAAINYAIANRDALNIRVINLSIAAGVYESYDTDPLTLAARSAVEAGIVVVASAGNFGRSADGRGQYGGITAPGNAPWVLTVGATSHMGTVDRSDDTVAAFSSRGPAAVDVLAKPDLLAPGVGIESLSALGSTMYSSMSAYLLPGTVGGYYLPYLSLSGTSMSAPVVSGTVALMLQANPGLTPNAVKAILQYTSQTYPQWDPLTQGAGFLNAQGAVELARAFADPSTATTSSTSWSGRILWGNRMYQGGALMPSATAWSIETVWGTPEAPGQSIDWGVTCASSCDDGGWTSWTTTSSSTNVVWGSRCGGTDCTVPWLAADAASDDSDTVVWGTDDGDTVVWGTSDDGDTVVWGTSCGDPSCESVMWSRP